MSTDNTLNAADANRDALLDKALPRSSRLTVRWIVLSFALLAIYLGFFYSVLGRSPRTTLLISIAFAHGWTAICLYFHRWFANGFEFLIHLVIAADIQMEGLVPIHEGYGFFFCGAAFWTVFWVYHFTFAKQSGFRMKFTSNRTKPS